MLTQAIHMMDQLIDLSGSPNRVTGFAATSGLRQIDTEDVAAAAMQGKCGAVGVLDATTTRFPTAREKIDIAAEFGSATLERQRLRVWLKDGQIIDVSEDDADTAVHPDYLAHRRLITDMLDAIELGQKPIADGAGSLDVDRLIEAIIRSNESGRTERVL